MPIDLYFYVNIQLDCSPVAHSGYFQGVSLRGGGEEKHNFKVFALNNYLH